jgi:hypothetical protein
MRSPVYLNLKKFWELLRAGMDPPLLLRVGTPVGGHGDPPLRDNSTIINSP